MGRPEQEMPTTTDFLYCGIERGVEIYRLKESDGSLSGIVFKSNGGFLTAGHVADSHKNTAFLSLTKMGMDIAYIMDSLCHGLNLGWVDDSRINGVEMVTSQIEYPKNLIVIPGRIDVNFYSHQDLLSVFRPNDENIAVPYFKPGASGSPLVYNNHIIGIAVSIHAHLQHAIEGVVFNGLLQGDYLTMRRNLERSGLSFEDIKLL